MFPNPVVIVEKVANLKSKQPGKAGGNAKYSLHRTIGRPRRIPSRGKGGGKPKPSAVKLARGWEYGN